MPKITARAAAEQLGLEHKEVIRRIRRKDIKAEKLDGGWFWLIDQSEIDRVKNEAEWYQRYRTRHAEA